MLLTGDGKRRAGYLAEVALKHPCYAHGLFEYLRTRPLTRQQAVSLLVNYDAHAGLLRRLLLKAAAHMPEPAVGFILENVRNEYGNGNYSLCHQGQLGDVIKRLSCTTNSYSAEPEKGHGDLATTHGDDPEQAKRVDCKAEFGRRPVNYPITDGIRRYMLLVSPLYCPRLDGRSRAPRFKGGHAAVAAGAVTATELMAIEEFKALQDCFRRSSFDLHDHPWFDHVNVEREHGEESLDLAEYFISEISANEAVEYGFKSTLDANVFLYDGLLEAIRQPVSDISDAIEKPHETRDREPLPASSV